MKGKLTSTLRMINDRLREVQRFNIARALHVRVNVLQNHKYSNPIRIRYLIKKFENEWNAVGKDKMLSDVLELIRVIETKMFQQKQNNRRNALRDDLLVSLHILGSTPNMRFSLRQR